MYWKIDGRSLGTWHTSLLLANMLQTHSLRMGLQVPTTLPRTPNPTHPHPSPHSRTSSGSTALLGICRDL